MSASAPLVSIGLPVYNGARYLRATLDAILTQQYANLEIIICDNASSDATAEICLEYQQQDHRIRYFRQHRNLGAIRNFNAAFQQAHGKYFKWASHDDLPGPDYVFDCVEFLEANPDYVGCWPSMEFIDATGAILQPQNAADLSIHGDSFCQRIRQLFNFQVEGDDIVPAIFALYRHSALARTRLWQRFTSSEEILMLELLGQGKIRQLAMPGFQFRIHAASAFQSNRTPAERQRWFDTDTRKIIQLPVWYLLLQYLKLIASMPLEKKERWQCYTHVLWRALRLWRRFAGDLVKYAGQFAGYRHINASK